MRSRFVCIFLRETLLFVKRLIIFTAFSKWIAVSISALTIKYCPISFMSNKLFLILNHWYVSAHTDEHWQGRLWDDSGTQKFLSAGFPLRPLQSSFFFFFSFCFVFCCKYGSLCMFTFLWASTCFLSFSKMDDFSVWISFLLNVNTGKA